MADGEGAAVGIATELEEILLLGGSGDEMPPPSCPKPAFAAIDPPGPAAAGGDGDASPERTPEPAGDNPGDNQGDSARPAALAPAGPGASDDAGAVPPADSGGAGDQASQAPPPAPPATMPGLAPSGGAGGESPPASPPPAAASATPGPEAEATARRPAPQQTTTALASTSASGSADPPQRAGGNKVAPSVDTDVSGTVQLPENTEEFILPKPARGSMLMNPGDYFSVTSAGSKVAVVNCDYQPTPRDGKANHISAKQGDFVMLEQEEQSLPAECVMVSTATTQGLLPKHVLSRIEGYSEGLHITRDELQLLPVEIIQYWTGLPWNKWANDAYDQLDPDVGTLSDEDSDGDGMDAASASSADKATPVAWGETDDDSGDGKEGRAPQPLAPERQKTVDFPTTVAEPLFGPSVISVDGGRTRKGASAGRRRSQLLRTNVQKSNARNQDKASANDDTHHDGENILASDQAKKEDTQLGADVDVVMMRQHEDNVRNIRAQKKFFNMTTEGYLRAKARSEGRVQDVLDKYDRSFHGISDLPRFVCYRIANHIWFEMFIILIIAMNVTTLALYDPMRADGEGRNATLQIFEFVFLAVYILEALIRCIAFGVFQPKNCTKPGYLQEKENILDFVIVVGGIVDVILTSQSVESSGITALRVLRIFRMLKFVKGFGQAKLVVQTIAAAVGPLSRIVVIGFTIMLMYTALGLSLYSGALNFACYWEANMTQVEVRPCGSASSAHHCADEQVCVGAGSPLLAGLPAIKVLANGTGSFDNAAISFYTVVSIVTQEGWTDVLYGLNDSMGTTWNWLYFVSLIIICGNCLADMMLGILTGLYIKEQSRIDVQLAIKIRETKERDSMIMRQDSAGRSGRDGPAFSGRMIRRNSILEQNEERGVPKFFDRNATYYISHFYHISENFTYNTSMTIIVLVNALFMALDHHPQSSTWDETLRIANFVFCGIFVVDVIIKLLGYGYFAFMKSWVNVMDLIVTALAILEIVIIESSDQTASPGLSALRCTRLLRVLKATGPFPQLSAYAQAGLHSFMGLAGVLVCVLVVILIASLMGMQLFGGKFYSRTNYDSFVDATITSIQIESGEGWNEVMMEAIQVSGGHRSVGLFTGLFFLAVLFIGHYVLLGIMLAITSTNLDHFIPDVQTEELTEEALKRRSYIVVNDTSLKNISLGFMGPDNRLRQWCNNIITNYWFDQFILFCIVVSSILLAVEDYRDPDNERNKVIFYFDVAFTTIFLIEMFLKITALGLVAHKGAYLRNGWNVLDTIAVLASVLALAFAGNSEAKVVKVLRIVRVLRPLRTIQRFAGLQQVVNSMVKAIGNIWGLALVAVGFMFFFSVMGVSLFKGQFSYCNDPTTHYQTECNGNFSVTNEYNWTDTQDRKWETHFQNFDNTWNALATLASIITFEEAPSVYYNAMDSTSVGRGPELNYKREAILYFLVYLFGMALFFLNIVMAFVGDTYKSQQDKRISAAGLSMEDAKCLRKALKMTLKPDQFYHKRGWWPFEAVTSPWFDLAVAILIVINLIVLLLKHDEMTDEYENGMELANYVIVGLFIVEAVLKIGVLSVKGYFTDVWNDFDFLIVIISLVDIIVGGKASPVSFLRLFRTMRLMKVFEMKEIRHIFELFVRSLTTMALVLCLLILVFYMYAVFGMALFAEIPLNDDTQINAYNNFHTFPDALLVLFRTMSGERWQLIMEDTYIEGPTECGMEVNATSCGSNWNIVYFNSFSLLTNLIVLNILLAAVVDSFEYLYQDESGLQPAILSDFLRVWHALDPMGTGKLHYSKMPYIIHNVVPPLGVGEKCPSFLATKFLASLPVPIDPVGHTIKFRATLMAMLRVRLHLWQYAFPDVEALRDIMAFVAPGTDPMRIAAAFPDPGSNELSLRFLYTVIQMQRHMRSILRIKRIKRQEMRFTKQMAQGQGKAGKVANKAYLASMAEVVGVLKLHGNSNATLAVLLVHAHINQIKMVLASNGKQKNMLPSWHYLRLTRGDFFDESAAGAASRSNRVHPAPERVPENVN